MNRNKPSERYCKLSEDIRLRDKAQVLHLGPADGRSLRLGLSGAFVGLSLHRLLLQTRSELLDIAWAALACSSAHTIDPYLSS